MYNSFISCNKDTKTNGTRAARSQDCLVKIKISIPGRDTDMTRHVSNFRYFYYLDL